MAVAVPRRSGTVTHSPPARRCTILESVGSQAKLTPELEQALQAADTKQRLEDLYAPDKPKRRTEAQVAREAGLEPLADGLLANPDLGPETEAARYLKAALEGARQILI